MDRVYFYIKKGILLTFLKKKKNRRRRTNWKDLSNLSFLTCKQKQKVEFAQHAIPGRFHCGPSSLNKFNISFCIIIFALGKIESEKMLKIKSAFANSTCAFFKINKVKQACLTFYRCARSGVFLNCFLILRRNLLDLFIL